MLEVGVQSLGSISTVMGPLQLGFLCRIQCVCRSSHLLTNHNDDIGYCSSHSTAQEMVEIIFLLQVSRDK